MELQTLRARVGEGALAEAVSSLAQRVTALEGSGGGRFGGGGRRAGAGQPALSTVNGQLLSLMELLEGTDAAPTTQAVAAAAELQKLLADTLTTWNDIKEKDLKSLNEQLRQANLPPLVVK